MSEGLASLRADQYARRDRVAVVEARSKVAREGGVRNAHIGTDGRLIGGERMDGSPGGEPSIFERRKLDPTTNKIGLTDAAMDADDIWHSQFQNRATAAETMKGKERRKAAREAARIYSPSEKAAYRSPFVRTPSGGTSPMLAGSPKPFMEPDDEISYR